jgi:peptide subunit release factor 1 (eRF1)
VEAIRKAAMAAEAAQERAREQALLDEVRSRLGRRERAVAGLDGVLAALADHKVDRLLVSAGFREDGWSCPACGRLSRVGPACPRCGQELRAEEDVVAAAVDDALTASCRVDVCDASADLDVLGRIAALLRY